MAKILLPPGIHSPAGWIVGGVLAFGLLFPAGLVAQKPEGPRAQTPPSRYGPAVASFCKKKLGTRVGGGECAHLASEALRVAGADFLRLGAPDSPGEGDYVWGALVKEVVTGRGRADDKHPRAPCQVGDVLQFRDATFAGGRSTPHHTSIVAAVDAKGYPTAVYEQNLSNRRVVMENRLDLLRLTKGWVRVYRPRATARNVFSFSLTNNSKSDTVRFVLYNNVQTLGAPDTAPSFRTWWGTAPPRLVLDGRAYSLKDRAGYEVYTDRGKLWLREVR